ncbi:MAG: GAF domain-containing sensor histidine kinase [Campylobacteraceae bacterium]|nr:GAF domain-containing sensor histidine kinase [Campylobacteraceae bacterium]
MAYTAINLFDDLLSYTTLEGILIATNDSYMSTFNHSKENLIGKEENEVFNLSFEYIKNTERLRNDGFIILDEEINLDDGIHYYVTKRELVFDQEINCEKIVISRKDITFSKQYLIQYKEHKKLLRHIASGKSIEFILNKIIKSVESRNTNMICSILLLDVEKKTLSKAAAPSLPDFYMDKLENMSIGEKVGSCGAAIYLEKRVIVSDISTHENWKAAKNLAERANLKACWSQPFFSSTNQVLGSFAIYYKKIKEPSEFDIYLIEDIASIVGIAIEKHQYTLKEERYKQEQKVQEKLLILKTKKAMMGEMLENIAHQWRQPLSVISTCATGALVDIEYNLSSPEKEKMAFENINVNAQYLSSTIDEFRKYFMSKNKKNEFKINDCIEHTKKLIDSRLRNNDIKIISIIENVTIINFENELLQVFMNIFNNAIDVLSNIDKKHRYIFLDVSMRNDTAVIKISDSGKGMKEKSISKIFNPYFTTKQKEKGSGIGLYMSHGIITKHMLGSIEARNSNRTVENISYEGLEFILKLPKDIKEENYV